jgi:NADPH:quinone reductase-like Zn-dependent oxidoreductase
MAVMEAIVLYEHGGPEQLVPATLDIPTTSPGETLVRVRACGVEPGLDGRTRQNAAGWELSMPHVLGASFAGDVVSSVGPDAPPPGTRVAVSPMVTCQSCSACRSGRDNACNRRRFLGVHRWGGYAEFAAVPTRNLLPIADETSYQVAASLPMSGTTAWHMLVTRGQVRPTDIVLVLGAAGSVGMAAAQIAALHGAQVILGGRDRDKLAQVADTVEVLGCVDSSGDLRAQVVDLTGDGVDVVVDTIGAETWGASIAALRPEGRIVCCGASSGADVTMILRELYRNNLSVLCSSGGTFEDFRTVYGLLDRGRLTPRVHATYPLADAAAAHRAMSRQEHVGKLVLVHPEKAAA